MHAEQTIINNTHYFTYKHTHSQQQYRGVTN